MKNLLNKIKTHRWLQVLVAFLLVSALSLGVWQGTEAAANGVFKEKSVVMEFGKNYDLSIGRAGVFFSNAQMEGTLVITRFDHPENHGGNCDLSKFSEWNDSSSCPGGGKIIWDQHMLEVRVYQGEVGARQYGSARGIGYVYFDMDILERRLWDDHGGERMSIWYFHDYLNNWVECPTTLRRDTSAPRGRLTCYLEEFGTYGLGLKQIPFINKLIKFGLAATFTPTPAP